MAKMTFMGAGSTTFAKNVLGDSMCTPALQDSEIALYDIDPVRLKDSELMLKNINENINQGRAKIKSYLNRREALRGADFVVNAIQVGGYKPGTVIDFEIPKKFGLRQTIADTLGIGGIFRALRTIPVVMDFARDMEKVCPKALFINYVNPMAMITGALIRFTPIRAVGICHSVQVCAPGLMYMLDMPQKKYTWKIAGINHQGWLLEITSNGRDLYPEIRRRAQLPEYRVRDRVRLEIMRRFGYYVTESSEHSAEYNPYFIKRNYPGLIKRFRIPLDEYIKRCIGAIEGWKKMRKSLVNNENIRHERTKEYASYIMEAVVTDNKIEIGGNVLNTGLIPNLPPEAIVEVPCLVNRNGVNPVYVGNLPEQLAGLNRTNINVQLMAIQAAITRKREHIYQAALLDPHTAAELSMDEIVKMCDAMIRAHRIKVT